MPQTAGQDAADRSRDRLPEQSTEQLTQPSAGRRRGAGTVLDRLSDRFGHLVRELGRFGTVGAAAYVVDSAIFNICEIAFRLHWLPSAVISTAIATTVAFAGNRYWTWRDRPRSGLRREYTLFFLFNAVGLAIGLGCLWFSHTVLGQIWPGFRSVLADNIAKQVVGMSLGTLFRFWSYRRYVFPAAHPGAPTSGSPHEAVTHPSGAR